MSTSDNEWLAIKPGAHRRRNAQYTSFTSSIIPFIVDHGTSSENEIFDQYLEESVSTEEVSESTITVMSAFAPWDPISDDYCQAVTCVESPKLEVDHATLSPISVSQPLILRPFETTPSQSKASTVPHGQTYTTDMSTIASEDQSTILWSKDSISPVDRDDSLEPLLTEKLRTWIGQSTREASSDAENSQQTTFGQRSGRSTMSKTATLTATTVLSADAQAKPLPSSTLFGCVPQPSEKSSSKTETITTTSKPRRSTQYQSVLRKSTEDMIKMIYRHHAVAKSSISLPFHEPVKHYANPSQNSTEVSPNGLKNGRKSVQWLDREFTYGTRDDMSDILDAYLEHGGHQNGDESVNKSSEQRKSVAEKLSARDREKAAARKIFKVKPDWQDLDKISKFLRVTKDLAKPHTR